MATTITRYVNTASTAGGNGTTNATTGANRAYATMNACVAALKATHADMVTNDVVLDVRASGATADTVQVDISGFTGDATRYLMITGEASKSWDTAKYRLTVAAASVFAGVPPSFTRLIGLQLRNANGYGIIDCGSPAAGYTFALRDCLIDQVGVARGGPNSVVISAGTASRSLTLVNNVVVGNLDQVVKWSYSGGTHVVYNNTVRITGLTGTTIVDLSNGGGTLRLHNNIVECTGAAGSCYAIGGHTQTSSANISSDNTSPQTALRSKTLTYVNAAAGDLTPASTDTVALDVGTNLSADGTYPFAADIMGTARPQGSAWDLGAIERIASGGSTALPVFLHQYRQRRS